MKFFPQQWLNQNHNVYFQSLLLFYPASYASLTLGVLQSTTGVIIVRCSTDTFLQASNRFLEPRRYAYIQAMPIPVASCSCTPSYTNAHLQSTSFTALVCRQHGHGCVGHHNRLGLNIGWTRHQAQTPTLCWYVYSYYL